MSRLSHRLAAIALALAAALPLAPASQAALDVAGLDRTVAPCADFYAYSNRHWLDATTIPADRGTWGTSSIVSERNESILREALEQAVKDQAAAPGSTRRKVADFYASGMDSAAIERAELKPLEALMRRIDATREPADLVATLAQLHRAGINAGFAFGVAQDAKDSSIYLAQLAQGGLGLPDRDYYFKDDERSRAQRAAYRRHLEKILALLGDAPDAAARNADRIIAFEMRLATASMTLVERRDPEKVYNRMTIAELAARAPGFDWRAYLDALGVEKAKQVNVGQPAFFKAFAEATRDTPAGEWRLYLRWHLVRSVAETLPAAFAGAHFDFYQRELLGIKEPPPRARHVVETIAGQYGAGPMGEAIGELYVSRAFPPQAKRKALALVENVKAALRDRIRELEWMGEETKAQALAKLDRMVVKIGYPDAWSDYSALRMTRDSFAANELAAREFDFRRQVARLGGPIDRNRWLMSPHIVNAYFDGRMNEIVFPAAILQPPFFDPSADDAANYGAIGMVIGHEITHGFDDRGRKFDRDGNLRDWWTPEDARRYEERARAVVAQYDAFEGVEGLKVNGRLTLGENIADLGGLRIAYLALQRALKANPQGPIDGLTQEQRFFIAFAQVWRSRMRPEQERTRILTDSHSPPRFRVAGSLANTPEFASAFACKAEGRLSTAGGPVTIW